MPTTARDIEAQALQRSLEERAQLADRLLASLATNSAVDDAWSAESMRRLAELDTGSAVGVPIEEAIARARAAIQ